MKPHVNQEFVPQRPKPTHAKNKGPNRGPRTTAQFGRKLYGNTKIEHKREEEREPTWMNSSPQVQAK